MSGFGDALQGGGLARLHKALEWLVADARRLDRARERFSRSPPQYISNPSDPTTQSASPILTLDEGEGQQRIIESEASLPRKQFSIQKSEELVQVFKAHENQTRIVPYGISFIEIAHQNVKKRWVEQGIWNRKWRHKPQGVWKHEEPLELEPGEESGSEAEGPSHSLTSGTPRKPRKIKRSKAEYELREMAERRVIRERERDASRPYYQFVYQMTRERERIEVESKDMEGTDIAKINTKAYENVKEFWIWQGIWNTKWGIIPGMSWKHEEPLEPLEPLGPPVPASSVSHEATKDATATEQSEDHRSGDLKVV